MFLEGQVNPLTSLDVISLHNPLHSGSLLLWYHRPARDFTLMARSNRPTRLDILRLHERGPAQRAAIARKSAFYKLIFTDSSSSSTPLCTRAQMHVLNLRDNRMWTFWRHPTTKCIPKLSLVVQQDRFHFCFQKLGHLSTTLNTRLNSCNVLALVLAIHYLIQCARYNLHTLKLYL